MRSAAATAENEINDKSSQLREMMTKNEELEALNDKLRIEFLQKVFSAVPTANFPTVMKGEKKRN